MITNLRVNRDYTEVAMLLDLSCSNTAYHSMVTETDNYIRMRVSLAMFGTREYNGNIAAGKWWNTLNL